MNRDRGTTIDGSDSGGNGGRIRNCCRIDWTSVNKSGAEGSKRYCNDTEMVPPTLQKTFLVQNGDEFEEGDEGGLRSSRRSDIDDEEVGVVSVV